MSAEEPVTQVQRRVGVVLERASRVLGQEPFYHEFIEGMERVLNPAGVSVLVKIVTDREAENQAYERWADRKRIDGVVLVDLTPDDDRVPLVGRLALPAVVLGPPSTASGLPTVWTDDAGYARDAVRRLAGRGHRTIGHLSGPLAFMHTQLRREGAQAEAASLDITLVHADGDYSYESACVATAELADQACTAILCDSDLMALAALDTLRERDLAVPADVSVVAWDDSALCQLAVPALSAMSHDVARIGEIAAGAMLDAMAGEPPAVYQAPPATFVARESTN